MTDGLWSKLTVPASAKATSLLSALYGSAQINPCFEVEAVLGQLRC